MDNNNLNNQNSNMNNQPIQPNYSSNMNSQPMQPNYNSNMNGQPMQPNYNSNMNGQPIQSNYNSNMNSQPMQPNYNSNMNSQPMQPNYNSNMNNQPMQPNYSSNIVQPSMNPGLQVNNSGNFNSQSNVHSNNSNNITLTPTKKKNSLPVKIIAIIVGVILVLFGGRFLLNLILLPFSTKVINGTISEAKLSAAKESAYGYIENIEKYVILSSTQPNYVSIPKTQNGNVKCSKIDSEIWSGEVLPTSSSCDEFMNAVEKSLKGSKPLEAEIIFDNNGEAQNGTILYFKDIVCKYNNSLITCEKSSKNSNNSTLNELSNTSSNSTGGVTSEKLIVIEQDTFLFISSIEHYKLLHDMDSKSYSVDIPKTKSGTVTCINNDGKSWNGEVLKGSSTCNDFIKAVEGTIKGTKPDGGKIILNESGEVLKGSWLKYNNIYCTYDGEKSVCSTKKPE